jgi:hypothetical protein
MGRNLPSEGNAALPLLTQSTYMCQRRNLARARSPVLAAEMR